MLDNTPQRFLFLLQRDEKAGFHKEAHVRRTGLLGAMFLDLTINGAIAIKEGKLLIAENKAYFAEPYKSLINKVNDSKKKRKLKSWISKLSSNSKKYEAAFLHDLQNKGYIQIEEKQFLWIKYHKTHLINHSKRSELINSIREAILKEEIPDVKYRPLYGLIHACDLYPIICRDKSERKQFKGVLSKMLADDAISQSVGDVIKETEAAILTTVIVSTVAATTVNSS